MSTLPATPPAKRGLPRPFVAFCVLVGVFIGAYAVLTLLSVATASVEHRTRTFPAVAELRIQSDEGDVTIVGERRDDIRVDMEIQRGMWRGGWQPEVSLRRDGRGLQLRSECSVWAHVGISDCGATFTIRVPLSTTVAVVDGGSGDVRVERIRGPIEVRTGSGDVEAYDLTGPLTLDAGSGDVEVDAYRGTALSARTGSGDIAMRLLRAPRRTHAEAGSGDVTIVLPDVPYRADVDTGSGDENVQLNDDPRAQRMITVRTGSGDVSIVGAG